MVASLTETYAQVLAGWQDLQPPHEALAVARLGFTDCAGVMLAGRDEDAVQCLRSYVRAQGGHGRARLVTGAEKVGMVQAGLVNATAAHALDYDDFAFSNHPSAILVPVVLAAADAAGGASGHRMAMAYLLGYEVWSDLMVREPDLFYDRGWHPTSVLGPIGAAAAASVVLGLDAVRTRHALALAASDSGGVFENFGTMAKPYHGGRAAAAGLNAAGLAAAGLAASATALEGRRGLMRALSPQGRVDLDTLPQVGSVWRSATMRLNIKKYPTVGSSQRVIDAVLALNRQQRLEPAQVRSIDVHVSERHAAVMPYHLPQDTLQAKFSIEFAIACALVHDAVGFEQLTDAHVRAPALQRLMGLVTIHTTEAFEPEWRDAAPFDIVHFTLADGRTVSSPPVRRAAGHADTPLTDAQLWAKFLGCARHAGVAHDAARALFDALQCIDSLSGPDAVPLPA
jgi:2-methylcitrate dehydratase PrpD